MAGAASAACRAAAIADPALVHAAPHQLDPGRLGGLGDAARGRDAAALHQLDVEDAVGARPDEEARRRPPGRAGSRRRRAGRARRGEPGAAPPRSRAAPAARRTRGRGRACRRSSGGARRRRSRCWRRCGARRRGRPPRAAAPAARRRLRRRAPSLTLRARKPRPTYSRASATASSTGLMPIVIEVGSASCARPSRSTTGRPRWRPRRSHSAMSQAARAAGAPGSSRSSSSAARPRSPASRPPTAARAARSSAARAGRRRLAGHADRGRGVAEPHLPAGVEAHEEELDVGDGAPRDGVRPGQRQALAPDLDGRSILIVPRPRAKPRQRRGERLALVGERPRHRQAELGREIRSASRARVASSRPFAVERDAEHRARRSGRPARPRRRAPGCALPSPRAPRRARAPARATSTTPAGAAREDQLRAAGTARIAQRRLALDQDQVGRWPRARRPPPRARARRRRSRWASSRG